MITDEMRNMMKTAFNDLDFTETTAPVAMAELANMDDDVVRDAQLKVLQKYPWFPELRDAMAGSGQKTRFSAFMIADAIDFAGRSHLDRLTDDLIDRATTYEQVISAVMEITIIMRDARLKAIEAMVARLAVLPDAPSQPADPGPTH
jgi:hypothetical protein